MLLNRLYVTRNRDAWMVTASGGFVYSRNATLDAAIQAATKLAYSKKPCQIVIRQPGTARETLFTFGRLNPERAA